MYEKKVNFYFGNGKNVLILEQYCMYVRMYRHVFVCTCVSVYVCFSLYVCMYVRVRVRAFVC